MCLACWDADKMEDKLKNGDACDGGDMLTMSLDELKSHVMEEWLASKKTDFRVFKQAVPSVNKNHLSLEMSSPLNQSEKLKFKINFI